MPSVSPSTSTAINVVLALLAAILLYLSKATFPSEVPPDVVKHIQEWSAFLLAFGSAAVVPLNGYLHAVSTDRAGPLAK